MSFVALAAGRRRAGRAGRGFVAAWWMRVAVTISLPVLVTGQAHSQSLPDVGGGGGSAAVRGADMRRHFDQASGLAGPTGAVGPAWQISPSLDVSEAFTDNAYYSGGFGSNGLVGNSGKQQWDLITQVTPGIGIVGDTSRVKVNLHYAPSFAVYARNSALDQVSQNLNGTLHGTILPETLFLDLRAFAGVQSQYGATGPSGRVAQDRQSQNQNYTFSAAPYAQHRFGSFGLGEVGYTASYGSNNGVTGFNNQALTSQQQLLLQQLNQSSTSHVVTQTEHAGFVSGEDFGRFSVKATAETTQFSGGGVYAGARNQNAIADVAYAVNRFIAAIGRFGYEKINYSGIPPVRIDDGVWAAGAKLTPNAESSITATIGHRYGERNVYFNGSYAATARLHVFATYSQALTTGLEDVQSGLDQVNVDSTGALYDQQTGAPIALVNNLFGVQNSVYRLDRASVNTVLIYARDVFSLALSREVRNIVSAAPNAQSLASSRGTYGSGTWTHDLNPVVSTSVYMQYGRNRYAGLGTTAANSFVGTASVTYSLSPTLATTALYSYSRNGGFLYGQTGTQNYVLVGVHKQF